MNKLIVLNRESLELMQDSICRDLDIRKELLPYNEEVDLIAKLREIVAYLLNYNMERLLWILYKLDVDEDRLKLALAQSPDDPESIITQLIIQREWQKIETRQKYKPGYPSAEEEKW